MIIITSQSDNSTFTMNGIDFPKNYQGYIVNDTEITVSNLNTKEQLFVPVNFDLIKINNVTPTSPEQCISLINKAVFKKGGGSGGGGTSDGVQSVSSTGSFIGVDNADAKNPKVTFDWEKCIPESYISGGNISVADNTNVFSMKSLECWIPGTNALIKTTSGGGIIVRPPNKGWVYLGKAGGGGWYIGYPDAQGVADYSIPADPYAGAARAIIKTSTGQVMGRFIGAWFATGVGNNVKYGYILDDRFIYELRDTIVGDYVINTSSRTTEVDLSEWIPPYVGRSCSLTFLISNNATGEYKLLTKTDNRAGGALFATEANKGVIQISDIPISKYSQQKIQLVLEGDPVGDINVRVHIEDYVFER